MLEAGRYHFVGVAGVGMSAVAQAVLGQGGEVSGSDRHLDSGQDLGILKKLAGCGIRLTPQDGTGLNGNEVAVVVSTAIESDNPDLVAARSFGVPVVHRSEILARLVQSQRCVAIAGTSGKSTVTGMAGWILECAGLDPNVVNGAPVLNWVTERCVGNTRIGASDLWVIEADESDRSLLAYQPEWAVITNMSADHFAIEETRALFRQFAERVEKDVIGGLGSEADYLAGFDPVVGAAQSEFSVDGVTIRIPLPGWHNAENGMHAVMMCRALGVPLDAIASALGTFKGMHRRLEQVGTAAGVAVVDDYAHNPAKIRAALGALSPFYKSLHIVWRPHGYGPLRSMLSDLVDAFAESLCEQDQLVVLPVYDVGGTADRTIGSDALVAELCQRGVRASGLGVDEAIERIGRSATPGDVIMTMGARDPGLPVIARSCIERLQFGL